MDLLKQCLIPNFCKYDGKFYTFSDGVPMGSPLSSLISEVFMDHLEKEILNSSHHLIEKIGYWHRYVDDILCLWNGDQSDITEFLALISAQYPTINFTAEVGGDRINFLDLNISISNGRHEFGIYI